MIVNPAGLYGGGAFKVDTTAATNYYLQQKAKEQAAKDALEKYYTAEMGKANSKGMREKEIPVFDAAVKDMQNYFIQNKKAILNGDAKAQIEFQQKKQTAFDVANSSISALNNMKEVGAIVKNPQAQGRLTQKTLGKDKEGNDILDEFGRGTGMVGNDQPTYIIDATGKVVKNPAYNPFTIDQISYNPPKLNQKEFQEELDARTYNIKPVETDPEVKPDPSDAEFNFVISRKMFTPDQLKALGDAYADSYKDETVRFNWDEMNPLAKGATAKSFKDFNDANAAFNTVYGKQIDPNSPDADKEYFVGKMLATKLVPQSGETQRVVNPTVARKRQEAQERRMAMFRQSLSDKDKATINDAVTGFEMIPDGTYGNVVKKGGRFYNQDGTPYNSAQGQADVNIPYTSLPLDQISKGLAKDISPLFLKKGGLNLNIINGVAQAGVNPLTGTISRTGLLQDRFKELGIKTEVPVVGTAPIKQTRPQSNKNTIKGKTGKTVTIPQ